VEASGSRGGARRQAGSPTDLAPGTLVDLFLHPIRRKPESTAFLQRTDDGTLEPVTFGEVGELVRDIALALRSFGLEPGDRVGIISRTRYEWTLADFAMVMAGLVSVPVYDSLTHDQIAFILENAGARAAIVSDDVQLGKLVEAAGELPDLRLVIAFDPVHPAEARPFEVVPWQHLPERGRAATELQESYEVNAGAIRPDDLATIIYTSGTTGPPKGVMLSHDNLYSNALLGLRSLQLRSDDLVLSWLPLSHVFERTAGHFCTWYAGAPVAFAESVETVARDMQELRPTFVIGVPRLFEKVYEAAVAAAAAGGGIKERIFWWAKAVGERRIVRVLAHESPGLWLDAQYRLADRLVFSKLRARTGGRIRCFVSGSAALSPQIARFFWAAGLPVLEGYGLTETSPCISLNRLNGVRLGTVGTPINGVEVRIADDGEILCRSPGVMLGYYRNEEATRETIDPDGWLRTGDVGELDSDGYLRITDRKKELIVTSYGKNIAPQPVEETIKRSRLVDQIALVGDGRKFLVALVVPNFDVLDEWASGAGISGSRGELVAHPDTIRMMEDEIDRTLEAFADYEKPKKLLLLGDAFTVEDGTLTPTLKVKRKLVATRYADRIERTYQEAERASRGGA
jgi:long-chain acyl-CoA synthetase